MRHKSIRAFYCRPINREAALGISYAPAPVDSKEKIAQVAKMRYENMRYELFYAMEKIAQAFDKIADSFSVYSTIRNENEEKQLKKNIKIKLRKEAGKKPDTVKRPIWRHKINTKAIELLQAELIRREHKRKQKFEIEMCNKREQSYNKIVNIINKCMSTNIRFSHQLFNVFISKSEHLLNTLKQPADFLSFIEKIIDIVETKDLSNLYAEHHKKLKKIIKNKKYRKK